MRCLLSLLLLLTQALPAAAAVNDDEGVRELVRKGIELMKVGDFESALAKFKDAQIEEPDAPQIHFNIGLALYKLKRFDEAVTSFEASLHGRQPELEKKALFHLGNCLFQQGKLQAAIDRYNEALERDDEYLDAKVNREFVLRRIKELAAKKKEKDEEKEQQKKIIEKLGDLIKAEVALHQGTRAGMLHFGEEVPKSRIRQLEDELISELPAEEKPVEKTPENLSQAFEQIGTAQGGILEKTKELLEEMRQRVEPAQGQPSPDPNSPPQPQDPEVEKIKRALPYVTAAEPAMSRARDTASDDRNWQTAHVHQEGAIIQLFKAMDELLDELSKMINDQALLMKDGFKLMTAAESPDESNRPDADHLRDQGVQTAMAERKLEKRCTAFAGAVEQQVKAMESQLDQQMQPGGQGVQPGHDPKEQIRRMGKALGHLNAASVAMLDAADELAKPDWKPGVEGQRKALEELIKAKQALSPPQEGEGKGDQKKQQNEEQKSDDQKKEGDQDQKDPQDQGQDQQKSQQQKKEDRKLSKEQAKKMLERARQRERDKRQKDKAKAVGGAAGGGKDW